MEIFKNDDQSYRAWLNANPDGFVLNTERTPAARYLKLHRAVCSHIKTWADRNPTSTGYFKVCSLELSSLENWARSATGGGMLDPCPTCHPRGVSVGGDQIPRLLAATHRVDERPTSQELLGCLVAAVESLDRHFAQAPERLADRNVDVELRRWLDGAGPQLDWSGQRVTADEWFFITTLYGQRTRDQQRSLIRQYFPRFLSEAARDVRNLTSEVTRDWVLDQEWMKPRLIKMGGILRVSSELRFPWHRIYLE